MTPAELFWDQEETVQKLHEVIVTFLAEKLACPVSMGEYSQQTSARAICNVGTIRILSETRTGTIAIGGTATGFDKKLQSIFQKFSKAISMTSAKPLDVQLMQSIVPSFSGNLMKYQVSVDNNSVICNGTKGLEGWAQINAKRWISLPVLIDKESVEFALPIFDAEEQKKMTLEFYGMPEDTRILLVDDSPTSRKLSRRSLSSAGYFLVEEFDDGQPALERLESGEPNFGLIVADWHMPNLKGIDLLVKIRESEKLKDLPVILLTGERKKEEVTRAIQAKVSGYVVKPFETEVLLKTIKGVFAKLKQAA